MRLSTRPCGNIHKPSDAHGPLSVLYFSRASARREEMSCSTLTMLALIVLAVVMVYADASGATRKGSLGEPTRIEGDVNALFVISERQPSKVHADRRKVENNSAYVNFVASLRHGNIHRLLHNVVEPITRVKKATKTSTLMEKSLRFLAELRRLNHIPSGPKQQKYHKHGLRKRGSVLSNLRRRLGLGWTRRPKIFRSDLG